jgi:hypothetical protein
LGYGVIGNTDDSGSFVLGSSPGTPASGEIMLEAISSWFLVIATFATAIFQLSIVLGAPLGAYSYGGSNPGKLSKGFRVASVFSALVMLAISGHYLSDIGILNPLLNSEINNVVNWTLVAFFALSMVSNNITRSKKERMVWAIPTTLMFLAALVIALNL